MCTRSLQVGVPNLCEYRQEYAPERVWTFPQSRRRPGEFAGVTVR